MCTTNKCKAVGRATTTPKGRGAQRLIGAGVARGGKEAGQTADAQEGDGKGRGVARPQPRGVDERRAPDGACRQFGRRGGGGSVTPPPRTRARREAAIRFPSRQTRPMWRAAVAAARKADDHRDGEAKTRAAQPLVIPLACRAVAACEEADEHRYGWGAGASRAECAESSPAT